jgi:hypothetical protein
MSEQFILYFFFFFFGLPRSTRVCQHGGLGSVPAIAECQGSHARALGLLILLQALLVHVTVLCAPFVVVVVFVIMGK